MIGKRILIFSIIFILVVSLVGCLPKKQEAKINLYFMDRDGHRILTEERSIEVPTNKTLAQVAVEELLKGPERSDLKTLIPSGTKLLGLEIKDGTVTVDFSKELLNSVDNISREYTVVSIVNTLTDISGIERVHILVEGKELTDSKGKSYGLLTKYNLEDVNRNLNKLTITLYFGGKQALYLEPEIREVEKDDRSIERVIIEELIKGPTKSGLYRTIPEGTKLISVEIKNGIAYVNFSRDLKEKHWGGSTGETFTIYSVVNSLTELPYIKKVQFYIEGNKNETIAGHILLDEPFERNENLIKR